MTGAVTDLQERGAGSAQSECSARPAQADLGRRGRQLVYELVVVDVALYEPPDVLGKPQIIGSLSDRRLADALELELEGQSVRHIEHADRVNVTGVRVADQELETGSRATSVQGFGLCHEATLAVFAALVC